MELVVLAELSELPRRTDGNMETPTKGADSSGPRNALAPTELCGRVLTTSCGARQHR